MTRRHARGRAAAVLAAVAVVVVALLLGGCSGDPVASSGAGSSRSSAAVPSSPAAASPPVAPSGDAGAGPAYSDWTLGARPLPVDADGQAEVLPTPRSLRVRRFRTTDVLPPPADDAFASTIGPITPALRRRMGETWSPRCPVALGDLRYLTMVFRGFDGRAHTGEMVVNARVARDVVGVFRTLFAADYPIEEMRLPTTADLDAAPTGDGNNTASMVCRAARGSTVWSAHAYGLAVDVNPFLNPYRKGDRVLPELASAYLDRGRSQPGIIHPGDVVVRAFERIGWTWGGSWRSLKDYQHFSATGR